MYVDEVYKVLCKIDLSKACGPDGIPGWLLREGAPWPAEPITKLYSMSLQSGPLPRDWRRANVAPVFKKSNKHSLSNYHPASLMSLVVKYLDCLVDARLSEFIKLSRCQRGFHRGHSCETQLLATTHERAKSLNKGVSTHVDFSKAFDSAPYQRLLMKLDCMGNQEQSPQLDCSIPSWSIESRELLLKVSPLSGWRWYEEFHRGPFLGPYISMILMLVWPQLFVSNLQMTVQFLGSSQIWKTVMISRQISTGSITGHNHGNLILTNPNAKSWQ